MEGKVRVLPASFASGSWNQILPGETTVESELERKDLGFLAIPFCGHKTFLWNSGSSVLTYLKVLCRPQGQTLMKTQVT